MSTVPKIKLGVMASAPIAPVANTRVQITHFAKRVRWEGQAVKGYAESAGQEQLLTLRVSRTLTWGEGMAHNPAFGALMRTMQMQANVTFARVVKSQRQMSQLVKIVRLAGQVLMACVLVVVPRMTHLLAFAERSRTVPVRTASTPQQLFVALCRENMQTTRL